MKFNTFQNNNLLDNAKLAGWDLYQFTDILKDNSRKAKKIKKGEYLEEGSTPIVDQGKDFIGGYSNLIEGCYSEVPYILFGDHTRIIKYIDFPSFIGADGVKVLKNIKEDIADTKFLYYFLKYTNIPNIGYNRHFKFLKEIIIPIPDMKIQLKIVDILEKIESTKNFRLRQLDDLFQLQQNLFNHWFYEREGLQTPLKEICEINPKKSEIDKGLYNSKVTFLPMSSVSEEGILNLSEKKPLKDVYSNYTYFAEDDVLFAKITPCMENGKGAIARGLENGIGFGSTEFHILRAKGDVTPEWLYFLTKSEKFRYIAKENMTGSAGQKRVPRSFIENYSVSIPSYRKQKEFREVYYKIEKIKDEINVQIRELDLMFLSMYQKMFNGDI